MSSLPPGQVLVQFRAHPATQVIVDLTECRRFSVEPPYNPVCGLDPGT
jgi:hypothetical protein